VLSFFLFVYLQLSKKKGEGRGLTVSRYNYVESEKADLAYKKNTPHVPLRQIAE
jgi:hypothetical protein